MQPPPGNPAQRPPPEFPEAKIDFGKLETQGIHQRLIAQVKWGDKSYTLTWTNTVGPGNDYRTEDQARALIQRQLNDIFLLNVRYKTDDVRALTVDFDYVDSSGKGEVIRDYHKGQNSKAKKTTPIFTSGFEFYSVRDESKVIVTQKNLDQKRNELAALQAQPNFNRKEESCLKEESRLKGEVRALEQKLKKREDRLQRKKDAQELFYKLHPEMPRPNRPPPVPPRDPAEQARVRAEQERRQEEMRNAEAGQEFRRKGQAIAGSLHAHKPLPRPPVKAQRPSPSSQQEGPPTVPLKTKPFPALDRPPARELPVVVGPSSQEPAAQKTPPKRSPPNRPLPKTPRAKTPPPRPPPREETPPPQTPPRAESPPPETVNSPQNVARPPTPDNLSSQKEHRRRDSRYEDHY